ncbi:MAG TPA: hypothetical protein PLO33_13175, partial [Kouleothrix sp.]|nr:hypothetical protein [Kouleothrix sp.]
MTLKHSGLSRVAALLRLPVVRIWLPALVISAALTLALGFPAHLDRWIGASALLLLLIVLGQVLSVELEDGSALTPTPALLIAGLTLVGWPLLLPAALLASLGGLLVKRRSFEQVLIEAGSRCLIVGFATPVYLLSQPAGALPYSTPAGLLGLLLIGAIAYTVKLIIGVDGGQEPLLARLRGRLRALRWYVLAMVPLGGLLGVLWSLSPYLFLLGLAPLIVAQYLFRSAVALRRTSADLERTARQSERLATRVERLQALATAMLGTLDVQSMLELLCQRLAALLDAPAGWVVLLDDNAQPQLMTLHNLPYGDNTTIAEPRSFLALLERGRVMLVADERAQALAPA